MIYYTFLEKVGVNHLKAWEPFFLSELYEFLAAPGQFDDPALRQGPAMLDLRLVNVEKLKMPDIRRNLMKKGDLGPKLTNFPCVYVVSGPTAHSIVTESLTFSTKTHGNANPKTYVTEELTEAAAWLAKLTGRNRFDVYREIDNLKHPLEMHQPNG